MELKKPLQEVEDHLLPKSQILTVKRFKLCATDTGITMPMVKISTSCDAYSILKRIHSLEGNDFQEFFYIVFLNRANKPTGYFIASFGGMTGTVADPRIIVKAAALANCTSILLAHNHPSGNILPSATDKELTQKIKHACSYFDIAVLDHIICGDGEHYSFADEGQL